MEPSLARVRVRMDLGSGREVAMLVEALGRSTGSCCSMRGVVIMKMMRRTKTRSRSGVMLSSAKASPEEEREERLMIVR